MHNYVWYISILTGLLLYPAVGSPERSAVDPLVLPLSVIGVAVSVMLLAVLVGVVIQAKIRNKKKGEQGDIPIESL